MDKLKSIYVALIAIHLLFCGFVGCGSEPTEKTMTPPRVAIKVPVEVVVKQRTTTNIPGSDGQLVLTVDDITRNQVMTSLAAGGKVVLPTRSISPKGSVEFQFGDSKYLLSLKELDNELVGEDLATFVISLPSENALTEEAKIEGLIAAVAELKDAKFIRNGTEHSPAKAAEHLQKKWDAARH
jgi:hypothetical protein